MREIWGKCAKIVKKETYRYWALAPVPNSYEHTVFWPVLSFISDSATIKIFARNKSRNGQKKPLYCTNTYLMAYTDAQQIYLHYLFQMITKQHVILFEPIYAGCIGIYLEMNFMCDIFFAKLSRKYQRYIKMN